MLFLEVSVKINILNNFYKIQFYYKNYKII